MEKVYKWKQQKKKKEGRKNGLKGGKSNRHALDRKPKLNEMFYFLSRRLVKV